MARVRVEVPVEPKKPEDTKRPNRQITIPQIERKKVLYILGALFIVIVLVVLINDRNHLKSELKKESSQSQTENQKYQSEVARLVEVPTGVTPQVKTPSGDELKKLIEENTIYQGTQYGDVFLVYPQNDNALFVVIYRPSTGKVILATQGSQTTKP